jgi:dinuclear metal center YbgI/SA1388 family protein
MNILEIENRFQTLFPKERGCSWDNDGLLVCSDRYQEVHQIVTCLDVTFAVIDEAIRSHAELIVSHHPLIFSPINRINEDTLVGQKLIRLLEAGISLISLHTRLDAAVGGLNDQFGKKLQIFPDQNAVLLEDEPLIGGIGSLAEKVCPESFAAMVSETLSSPVKLYSASTDISRIAYCCGSGKGMLRSAFEKNADAFVGGDLPYHEVLEAVECGMTVIDCGHFASEKMVADLLKNVLISFSSSLKITAFSEDLGGEIVWNS